MFALKELYKIAVITTILLSGNVCVNGQVGFDLDDGTNVTRSSINGHDDIQLSLNINAPGIIVGEQDFKLLLSDAVIQPAELDSTGFGGDLNKLLQVWDGTVKLGDLIYTGKIYVFENINKRTIPLYKLWNSTDSTANLIRINFSKKRIDFVSRDSINITKLHKLNIIDYMPFPVIESTLELEDTFGHEGTISGRFAYNLAVINPLWLLTDNIETSKFIKKQKFKQLKSRNKIIRERGIKAIFAGLCKIDERTLRGVHIVVGSRGNKSILGFMGYSMFNRGCVIFDRENDEILYE